MCWNCGFDLSSDEGGDWDAWEEEEPLTAPPDATVPPAVGSQSVAKSQSPESNATGQAPAKEVQQKRPPSPLAWVAAGAAGVGLALGINILLLASDGRLAGGGGTAWLVAVFVLAGLGVLLGIIAAATNSHNTVGAAVSVLSILVGLATLAVAMLAAGAASGDCPEVIAYLC